MTTAREEILARISRTRAAAAEPDAAYARIERSYRQSAELSHAGILDLLEERLVEYDARVYRVAEPEIAATVTRLLAERKVRRVIVPRGLPAAWIESLTASATTSGAEFAEDSDFDAAALDSFDGVMTASKLAIAETGTIVLESAPSQGRRAITLVPDYHLCVVRERDVVETVVEGMRLLDASRGAALTFFSGPSATADIEMTRIKGVHGPRFVDVLLVRD